MPPPAPKHVPLGGRTLLSVRIPADAQEPTQAKTDGQECPSSQKPALRGKGRRRRAALAVTSLGLLFSSASMNAAERQVTREARGHVLTNVNVWSADGQWIVYDTRVRDDQFTATTIERVHVDSGKVEVLYEAKDHANVGVVTAHPREPRVVFIHGPEHPTAEWSYAMTRRRGAWVEAGEPGRARNLDAMNYGTQWVPGALRGGSHVHVYSPDGQAVSFTYDDEILARLGAEPSPGHDLNQRNVGVAVPAGPVIVSRDHARNHDGEWFSVLVTRTTNSPNPGSDEISRACEEGWIGANGYLGRDGTRQKRALAFQGTVTARDGSSHAEVFVVDLPDDLTVAGDAPLQGTATRRPAPPRGTVQRRLTFTDDRKHPGIAAAPRHWLRSSPDGASIAFLMKDDDGVVQVWTIAPLGGEPRQVTRNAHDIASAFTWSPDGRRLAFVMDGSVCSADMGTGATSRLTARAADPADSPRPFACVFSPAGDRIAFTRSVAGEAGRFDQIFVVDVPLVR